MVSVTKSIIIILPDTAALARTNVSAPSGREAFERVAVEVSGWQTDGQRARGDWNEAVSLYQSDVVVPERLNADVVFVDY